MPTPIDAAAQEAALLLLHRHSYDPAKAAAALEEQLPGPPRHPLDCWSTREACLFTSSLLSHGKDFFAMRKHVLPQKRVSELVDFYYARKPSPLRLEVGRACFIDARCVVLHPQRTVPPPPPPPPLVGEGATPAAPASAAAAVAAAAAATATATATATAAAAAAAAAAKEEAVVGGGSVPAAAPLTAVADPSEDLSQEAMPQTSAAAVLSHVGGPFLTREQEGGEEERGSAGASDSGAPAPAAAAATEAETEAEAEGGGEDESPSLIS